MHEKPAINEDIHRYAARMVTEKRRLAGVFGGDTAVEFLNHLALSGLSPGRQCFYATRIVRILREFERLKRSPKQATKKSCEQVLAVFVASKLAGETKLAYALCLQRLVHYAKTGELGNRKTGYAKEVAWIMPSRYKGRSGSVQRKDLLTPDEFHRIVSCTNNRRDRAMLWVMYEGAFRPGELLNMRVGGVEFADQYVVVSTHGKTDQKTLALVLSFRPLLEWMQDHPYSDDPDAPLWYSPWPTSHGALTYQAMTNILRRAVKKAGIKKPVWNYLLRHTQLTELSKKLPDQLLRVYGNWSPGSKMTARYTHLSAQDAKDAMLKLHGISTDEPSSSLMRPCPRCNNSVEPDLKRCSKCGYLLDEILRASVEQKDLVRARTRDNIRQANTLEKKIDVLFGEILNSEKDPKW